jgi:hypothetical protein
VKPLVNTGCTAIEAFPLPQEDAAAVSQQLAKQFGSPKEAFRPYFAVAEESDSQIMTLPQSIAWEEFIVGFNALKEKMARSYGTAGSSPLRESFLAMLAGVLGNTSRWQLWFADKFSAGLTAQSFVMAGYEAQHLMLNHWAEAESGKYSNGETRRIFGQSWQPKGWATKNRRAVASLGKFISALEDLSVDAESRASKAATVLDEFKQGETLSGFWITPHVCDPVLREGLAGIQTPEDYQRNDKGEEAPQSQGHGKRQGTRMRGTAF